MTNYISNDYNGWKKLSIAKLCKFANLNKKIKNLKKKWKI